MTFLPETLPVRATNQYRRRDTLAYVGLRFYLKNAAALRDNWSSEICCEHLRDRTETRYHVVRQFKEYKAENDAFEYRVLHIPPPNEVLAEVALLNACAECGNAFRAHPNVFSYILPKDSADERGVFAPYYDGFKERHRAIAKACLWNLDATVVYTDIRKFYPSITLELAERVWNHACEAGCLTPTYRALGLKLLSDYRNFAQQDALPDRKSSLPTGPMFSHLIANLVFHDIDKELTELTQGGYFRYVDDVAFVGTAEQVANWENQLKRRLESLGLGLHPDKRIETVARDWLRGAFDFESGRGWAEFIGTAKRYLMFRPEKRAQLASELNAAGIRIRPMDYSEAVKERPYLERVFTLLDRKWLKKAIRMEITRPKIVSKALSLRNEYALEFTEVLSGFEKLPLNSYERKRRLYRLRFLLIRLMYLGTPEQLHQFGEAVSQIPELALLKAVFEALRSRDATNLLRFGPTATQTAALPLLAQGHSVRITKVDWSNSAVRQAYAMLLLHGVPHDLQCEPPPDNCPMIAFCKEGAEGAPLFRDPNIYFRELACLRGLDNPEANTWALTTAFDFAEDILPDVEQLLSSSS